MVANVCSEIQPLEGARSWSKNIKGRFIGHFNQRFSLIFSTILHFLG